MSAVRENPVDAQPVANRALGRQLVYNSAATAGFYAMYLVIGLWYPRYTLFKLGVSMVAMTQLAASFINYIAFATSSISGSVGRFVLADAARGDMPGANRTFNTYLVAAEKVSMVMIAAIALVVWFIVPRLDYPPGMLNTTRFVFAAILMVSVIEVWKMCFDCSIWVSGRIDIRISIQILEMLTRIAAVVLLFNVSSAPNIWHIGAANLLAASVALGLYVAAWWRLTPELTIDRQLYDPVRFREIRGVGGWMFVQQIAGMLFSADLILLNRLVGRQLQGSYAYVLAWAAMLRSLFGAMGGLISPSMAALHASRDYQRVAELCTRSVHLQGLLISIPVGILCGLASPALNWWIGPNFTFLAPLAWLILVPLAFEASFFPAAVLLQAPESIRVPSIFMLALGCLNVGLAIVLVKFTSLGMYGVAYAAAITAVIRSGIVLPICAARVFARPWYSIIQQQAQMIVQLGITGVIAFYMSRLVTSRSLFELGSVAALAGAIATVLVLLQLSQAERTRLLALVRRR